MVDALGKSLTRWQQHMLDAFARADQSFTVQQLGRRSGRAAAHRLAIAAALALGGHVHVEAHDGLWCVRSTALGALWEQLPRPAGLQNSVTYDEVSWRRPASCAVSCDQPTDCNGNCVDD
jgi:hypothetical protein